MNKRAVIAALTGLALWAGIASAQNYPSKPIRWIVPFAAGGPSDVLSRAIAPELSRSLGVPVVVENKPGAGGSLGMDYVSKQPPDGYVIGMGHSGTQAINPHLYAKLNYDALKDFVPITPLVRYVNVFLCNPKVQASNMTELVRAAKARPNTISVASGGNGSTAHLSLEVLKSLSQAPLVHVPYKGAGPAMNDLVGGQVDCMFDILVTALPQLRAGRIKALAVTSATRSQYAPDIPTMAESGLPGYDQAGSDLWFGMLAPAGTPKPIIDRLNAELAKVMDSPVVRERMVAQSFDRWTLSPQEFATFLRADYDKWGKMVRQSGAKAD